MKYKNIIHKPQGPNPNKLTKENLRRKREEMGSHRYTKGTAKVVYILLD